MIYTIDFDHIFFDKYPITNKEKRDEAEKIWKKILNEKNYNFKIENCTLETEEDIDNLIETVKKEFFILTIKGEFEKIPEDSPSKNAQAFISKNFTREDLTVEEICTALKLTRSELESIVKKQFGCTVRCYIRLLRVEKAKEMLSEGVKTEIVAYTAGFGSVKTMQRAFKEVTGSTPSAWRGTNLDSNKVK